VNLKRELTMKTEIDRSELAIWAENTRYSTDDLVREYGEYVTQEREAGREPLTEARWANTIKGIANV
jgi:hypothetical protein